MRTIVSAVLMLLMVTVVSFAACGSCGVDHGKSHKGDQHGQKSEMKDATHAVHKHMPSDNVVKIDGEGKQTALCGCGMEVTVTDETVFLKDGDMTFYTCSENCKTMMESASGEAKEKMMQGWHTKFAAYELADNTFTKGDVLMANCACGAKMVVNDDTPLVTENGMKVYCCSEGCHDMFMGMDDAKRLEVERKVTASD